MRLNQAIVRVASSTGWPLEYIGQLPIRRFRALCILLDYQRGLEIYKIEHRLGQVMCILASTKQRQYKPDHFVGQLPKLAEVTDAMTTKAKASTITLGDGKAYKLATLNVNMMEVVEEEFNQNWTELMTNPRAKVAKALVHAMLKPNYPEITREQVGELLTATALFELQRIIVKQVK